MLTGLVVATFSNLYAYIFSDSVYIYNRSISFWVHFGYLAFALRSMQAEPEELEAMGLPHCPALSPTESKVEEVQAWVVSSLRA